MPPRNVERPYWGDLHSHCSISYGHGTVEQALLRAREQLDFCSVTGHAFWPDMPDDRSRYAEIIDYHTTGFARCRRNWPRLLEQLNTASRSGEFVAFPSYEWHSLKYGDHNVYSQEPVLELHDEPDLPALRRWCEHAGAIAIPHHIGYAAGYRGIDWDHYREEVSPFVEIFSLHGCSLSDDAPCPMLHDMGPRDAGSTAEAGWERGRRFGIVGGSDHHGAYPGSHGDGRMGVFADALTRQSLWDAMRARRVFAVTGDKIDARHFVNDAWIGSEIVAPGERRHRIVVRGSDALDRVELVKNGRIVQRFFPLWHGSPSRELTTRSVVPLSDSETSRRFRLRITWGWGRKTELVRWTAGLSLSEGTITEIETCFSGQPIVAPQEQRGDKEIPDDEDLPHQLTERSDNSCAWRSVTTGNPTMRHATTQAISLEIDADPGAVISVEMNGQAFTHSLAELLHAGRSHYLRGWLSEAVRIGPAVPLSDCEIDAEWTDRADGDTDRYRLQVAQVNGQWAWLSPIWARR
ncbi:MAG: DUF3604 domain-containing protein [Planctomycetaceae bacterium]